MKSLFALTIRTQLLLITTIIAMPAIVIIVLSGVKQRENAIDETYKLTRLIAERIASEQNNTANATEQLLVTLAQMPVIKSQDREKVQPLISKLKELNPQYSNILVADAKGQVWATVVPFPKPSSITDRRYFQNAISTGKLSSGEYIFSRTLSKPAFNFAYPYRDASGKISGVIGVGFSLDRYSKILNAKDLPKDTNFLLLDHNGVVLSRAVQPDPIIGKKYPEKAFKQMVAGPDEFSYRGRGSIGDERFISYRKIKLAGESTPYMYVRVGVPVSSALYDTNKSIARNIALLSSFLISAFMLSYLVAKYSIADRIILLKKASQHLASGEQGFRVSESVTGGELGELAQSFDSMAHRLAEREKIITDSEQKFKALFQNSSDPTYIADCNGRIIAVNEQACHELGYTSDELLQLTIADIDDVSDPKPVVTAFQKMFENGGAFFETMHRRKDGKAFPVEVKARLIDYAGQPAILGIARDLSIRKQSETELKNAKEAAESASRAKSEFLANMSHEIRTPMNGVLGMAQLLHFTKLTAEQQEYLACMEVSAKNLLTLLNDILDLSKIEAGKIELESLDFSLRASISEVVMTFEPQLKDKGLELSTEIPVAVPDALQGDQLRLKQIILNLLGNAIKFTNSGKIDISVTLIEKNQKRCVLRLSIQDTGIGMSQEVIERIFAPFTQADTSTTRKFGGTGLGLSICRRLVELMDGKVWAESTPGVGSCFNVELPFDLTTPRNEFSDIKPLDPPQLSPSKSPLSILVADDNEVSLRFVTTILNKLGHSTKTAHNGLDALNLWRNGNFDLILMDVTMPEMDGIEAIKTIRLEENSQHRQIPAIALTAHAFDENREKLISNGFNDYLAKPLQIAELQELLLKYEKNRAGISG